MIKLAPSILSADFTRLGDQISEAEAAGADWIHVDVMDGHFVPNITIGPLIAAAARRSTALPLDVHLMIESPDRYLEAFVTAGANSLTVHAETCPHLHRTMERVRQLGAQFGVAINPATSLDAVREIAPYLDLLLVMSVNPGFGGQRFIPTSLDKVRRARALLDEHGGAEAELQVDGGVDAETIGSVVAAGATVLVAGSAVYNAAGTVADNLRRLREAAAAAAPA